VTGGLSEGRSPVMALPRSCRDRPESCLVAELSACARRLSCGDAKLRARCGGGPGDADLAGVVAAVPALCAHWCAPSADCLPAWSAPPRARARGSAGLLCACTLQAVWCSTAAAAAPCSALDLLAGAERSAGLCVGRCAGAGAQLGGPGWGRAGARRARTTASRRTPRCRDWAHRGSCRRRRLRARPRRPARCACSARAGLHCRASTPAGQRRCVCALRHLDL